jgi:hypothetical protein
MRFSLILLVTQAYSVLLSDTDLKPFGVPLFFAGVLSNHHYTPRRLCPILYGLPTSKWENSLKIFSL